MTTPCVLSPTGCEGFLLFDPVHPTTAGRRLVGEQFFMAVTEPTMPGLLIVGLVAMLFGLRRPRVAAASGSELHLQ